VALAALTTSPGYVPARPQYKMTPLTGIYVLDEARCGIVHPAITKIYPAPEAYFLQNS